MIYYNVINVITFNAIAFFFLFLFCVLETIRVGNRTREKCKITLYWDSWYRQYEVRCEQAGHSPSSVQGHSPSSSCRPRNAHLNHYTPPITPTLFNHNHSE